MTTDPIIMTVCEEYAHFMLFAEETTEAPNTKKKVRSLCKFAEQFEFFVRDLCQQKLREPTPISLNQAYLQIFLKYMEWRLAIPKAHRNHVGERGHRCIWHVLEDAYFQLRRVELTLVPPMLFLPPPPPPIQVVAEPSPSVFAGIFAEP